MGERADLTVIVNKWWECDAVMAALLDPRVRPPRLPWPELRGHPRQRTRVAKGTPAVPRAVFRWDRRVAELWCVSDLLEDEPEHSPCQSSSEYKAERLTSLFKRIDPKILIAVGTGSSPSEASLNGSVFIGGQLFMRDGHDQQSNPHSRWKSGKFDTLIRSSLNHMYFTDMASSLTGFEKLMLPTPVNPANTLGARTGAELTALNTINVTDSSEYLSQDKATLQSFNLRYPAEAAAVVETTHGVICSLIEVPFVHVSGIANRTGRFDDEVKLRRYAQNFIAAHNAGVALAGIIPCVADQ